MADLWNIFTKNILFCLKFIRLTWIILSFKITVPLFLNHAQVRVNRKAYVLRLKLSFEQGFFFLNFNRAYTLCHLEELLLETIEYHDLILIVFVLKFFCLNFMLIIRIPILDKHLKASGSFRKRSYLIIFRTARLNDSFERLTLLRLWRFFETLIDRVNELGLLIYLNFLRIFLDLFRSIPKKTSANRNIFRLLFALWRLSLLIDVNFITVKVLLVNCQQRWLIDNFNLLAFKIFFFSISRHFYKWKVWPFC